MTTEQEILQLEEQLANAKRTLDLDALQPGGRAEIEPRAAQAYSAASTLGFDRRKIK